MIWDNSCPPTSSAMKEPPHGRNPPQYARNWRKLSKALYPERSCKKMEERVNCNQQSIIDKHARRREPLRRVEAASSNAGMLRNARFKGEQPTTTAKLIQVSPDTESLPPG